MFGVVLVALVTVLVPLSLCVVPSFARYTIFPLLSSLIHRFMSAYVLPTLQIEYFFGSFNVRGSAREVRDTLRGVTVSLLQVQLQPDFLKTLAFEKKGTGPVRFSDVAVREVSLHLGSKWRVVVDVNAVDVHAHIANPNAETLVEVRDAVAMKVAEAAGWVGRFSGLKAKQEANEQVAQLPEGQKTFGFKDRVMQLVVAQIDIQVRDVNVVVDAPSMQTARNEDTRIRVVVKELEVLSSIVHENLEEAQELVLTSVDIRESHKIRIDGLAISAEAAVEEWKKVKEEEEEKPLAKLLDIPSMELSLNVPPMARLLGLVPNFSPIPLDKRVAGVELLLPTINRATLDKDALVRVLQDAFVPYSDYQVVVKTAKNLDAEFAARNPASADDIAFYLESFKKIETNAKMGASEKEAVVARLQDVETHLSLNQMVKLRMKSLGLDVYFGGPDCDGLDVKALTKLTSELSVKPENIMFSKMAISLRLETFAVEFLENHRPLAEFSVNEFGVNLNQFTVAQGDEKLLKDVDLTLEQVIFAVIPPIVSTVGPAESPSSKIMYADFTHITPTDDVATRPQQIAAKVKQFECGKLDVGAALSGIQIAAAAYELECFFMYVDRLSTEVGQVMATARPMPTLPPLGPMSSIPVTSSLSPSSQQTVIDDLAPFALLGGKPIELDLLMDGCRMMLLPTESFEDAIYVGVDVESAIERSGQHGMGKSRVEVPVSLRINVSSSKAKEYVKLDVTKIGIIARYLDGSVEEAEDTDRLLAPAAFSFVHELQADKVNSLINRQKVSVTMPNLVLSFSDLSLALVSSCTHALSTIQTTTPEQAQLRMETRLKLEAQQQQVEIDAIIGRIRRMFDEIDEDKSGHIDLGELLVLLRRAKVAESLLERELEYFVRVLFKEIDRDGNGFIEFDELREYLRDDLLSDGTALTGVAGSGELGGTLNLRGGEYASTDEFEKLSGGVKPISRAHMEEIVTKPFFSGRFFDLYESETHATKTSLNGQRGIDVQKKLVRLLGNYDAAELCWNLLIQPELPKEKKTDWVLQVSTHCGGVSEYQNAAKVIARQKKDTIFATALREAEQMLITTAQTGIVAKKKLVLETDFKLGNLRFVLTDPELPVQFSRGFFAIQNVKLSFDVNAGDIAIQGPVDWVGVATSGSAEWTALFGLRVIAQSYSDLAHTMEDIIEPWELVGALSSSIGENGVAVLVEAEKRFQINVTPGFLKMYRALNDVFAGNSGKTAWKKHQEAFRTGLTTRSSQSATCMIHNLTGCAMSLVVGGDRVEIEADQRVYTKHFSVDGSANVESFELPSWGRTKEATPLPSFGVTNVRLVSDSSPGVTVFVSAYCRLEDPMRQRIVLKSNLYMCNHSSQVYELKYLTLGSEDRASFTSEVIRLRSNERTTLPVSVLLGITEVYARPVHFNDWIVKATLNDDLMTSAAAVQDVDEQENAMRAKLLQRRGGSIVYGVTQENNSKLIKQLAPGVMLRRWHLRSHFEWEMSLLPLFVVRNSLPYTVEYRFVEYNVKTTSNAAAAFAAVEAALKADDDEIKSDVICGSVPSGQDAEVTGMSCLSPGYLSVRMVSKMRHDSGEKIKSKWSKPLLMAIHNVEQFTVGRQKVDVEPGVALSLDRLALPNLPRMVRFSCPYWIVNNTSLDLSFASAAAGAKTKSLPALEEAKGFNHPRMTYLDSDRLSIKPICMSGKRPVAWNTLGKVPAAAYSANPITDEALKTSTWSEPMNSTTVNTVGEVACGASVFAVKIEGLYGSFEQSVALTVSPRFYVQNRLKEKIFIQTFGSSESPEDVDQKFRTKRSAAEAKVAQSSVLTGESTPMYHFFPLKNGESLNNCQKYIALSFSETWGGDAWSHVISVSTVGDTYIQLYSPLRQRHIICLASVQVIDMAVYVVLSDSSSSPPYRIENYTPFKIECSQIAEGSSIFKAAATESARTIKNGDWYAFAWSNSLSKEHKMKIRMQHADGRSKEKSYDIDAVGYHDSIVFDQTTGSDGNSCQRVEVIVQTVVDEGTRVLKFLEKELEMHRLENQDAQFEQEFESRKMIFASSFDLRIAGFGLSLFDALPQEVFFVSADVIQVQKTPSSLEWNVSLFHSQVDNMLPSAKFPVVLNPLNSGYSDKTPGKPAKPLVKLVLDADLAAKIGIYKLMEFQLNSVGLKVDLDYIVNLVKLVEPFLTSDAAMSIASTQTIDRVLKRPVPPVPAAALTADGSIRHNLVYFDLLRVGAFSVDLEYSITRKDIVSTAGGSNSVVFGLITQVIGLIGSNLSGSPTLSFSEIIIQRCFSTKERLQHQLIQNFIRQAVMQAYRLIGSADIIGDPIGLVEDLGSGVVEFFKMTKDELTGDSQTRGEGVKILGKTVARTGASTLAKITGSLDKFVGDFSQEDEGEEAEVVTDGSGEASGDVASGGLKFARDLGKGFTGIFTKPVEGAMKGGVTGLLQGTVQGIAGPGVVLLKQITSTTHTIALGVQSTVVDRSVFGGRRRKPKNVEGNRVVADYDEKHFRPTRLLLEVISAQGLLSDDSCDPMCVVRIDDEPILKTNVLYNTLNPVWHEKAEVELTGKETEVQFVVKDSYGGAINKTIGKCAVLMEDLQEDFQPPEFSSSLAQWVKTGVKPTETKKNVSNVVKEKEYTLYMKNEATSGAAAAMGHAGALLGMGSSNRVKMGKDDVQVLVTIKSLRDLKITNSSGGGMLGLGNLVSSTPNISPFVSIHVATGNQTTHTATMKFSGSGAQQKGNAVWNESFTFPVVKKDAEKAPPGILLSLKDKSILRDETLGFANLPIPFTPTLKPVEKEVEVRTGKNGSGDVVGYITLKVEVIGATASSLSMGAPKVTTPKAGSGPLGKLSPADEPGSFKIGPDAVKAGKIRVACEFA